MPEPQDVLPFLPQDISVIAFDGDDTLWHSENYFSITEARFQALVAPWCASPDDAAERLLQRERDNLKLFGYGIKGFTLSMIETAVEASDGSIPVDAIQQIIDWGKEMLAHPVDLLPGVTECLDALAGKYRLLIVTKGDLFHQESKVAESGLAERFEAIHIVSEKDPETYARIIQSCGVAAEQFLMVGNSVRSDIQPVTRNGGRAIHVPYAVTWGHETDVTDDGSEYAVLASMTELASLLV